jgi:tetratricopeptide (TPR) repeat protein
MLTWTTPLYHKVRDNNNYRLADSNVTLAEILQEKGFATGAFVGAFVMDSQFGLDQGFDTYDDDISKANKAFLLINERKADDVTRRANVWLDRNRTNKSFLFIHYFDPHIPYEQHKGFAFTSFPFAALTRDLYDSEIAYTDYHIGLVIQKLKELQIYDSTLLIVTGDHGESLGQHHEESHGFAIYHSTIHVPLIIKIPGRAGGEVINDTVGLIDIVPTVCGLLGIAVPSHVQGKDLNAFIGGRNNSSDTRYLYCESLTSTKFEFGPFLGLTSGPWKYIHTSEPELYNLEQDPAETKNLFEIQSQQARQMREQLGLILQAGGLSEIEDGKAAIDDETRKRLLSLGYVAGRTVDETIDLGNKNLNPTDFIEAYDLAQKALILTSARKFARAKKLWNKMLEKWPRMKIAHNMLGVIAISEKDMQAAIKHLSLYLELTDQDSANADIRIEPAAEIASCHFHLAQVLRHQGRIVAAFEHYQKAEELFMELGLHEKVQDVQKHLEQYKNAGIKR